MNAAIGFLLGLGVALGLLGYIFSVFALCKVFKLETKLSKLEDLLDEVKKNANNN